MTPYTSDRTPYKSGYPTAGFLDKILFTIFEKPVLPLFYTTISNCNKTDYSKDSSYP